MDDEPRADESSSDGTRGETFPADDPGAREIGVGVDAGVAPKTSDVADNRVAQRFELVVDGQTAFLQYRRTPVALVLVHTEVPQPLRGRHFADLLAKAAIEYAHAEKRQVVAVCPFVRAYLRKQRESSRSV